MSLFFISKLSDSYFFRRCSVCEGPPHKRGIYIHTMEEGSVARMAGIKPGDQILHCNGRDFTCVHFYDVSASTGDRLKWTRS